MNTKKLSPLGREMEKIITTQHLTWSDIARHSNLSRQRIDRIKRQVSRKTKVWRLQKVLKIPEWQFACLMFGVKLPKFKTK